MIRILLLTSLISLPAHSAGPIVVESGDRQTAVVELYTSEGCSSCPPADRWFSQLVETPRGELDVLALAFHVDYWNYLGWSDRFSSAEYTNRQRQLGANNQQRTIYTPEFFVNGMEARGSRNILDQIRDANGTAAPLDLRLTVSREQTGLALELLSEPKGSATGPMHYRYLVYENNLSSDVRRGENAGETLSHQQVVRYMSEARILRGENRHRIELDPDWKPRDIGVAVVVTSPGSRQYLQALHTPVSALLVPAAPAN